MANFRNDSKQLQSRAHLSFREAEAVGELLPFRSHHVVVFLERVFQPQQLRGRKRRADSFGLSGQRVVQKEALRTRFVTCERGGGTHTQKKTMVPVRLTFGKPTQGALRATADNLSDLTFN